MNKTLKIGFASLALTAAMPVIAADSVETEVENEYEAIGWTPIAVGLASPVQLPWGSHKWDVFGLDLSILWADAPKMYGLGLSGIAMATRDDLRGLQVTALCNWATKDVRGARVTVGGNLCWGTVYGMEVGLFGWRNDMWGWDTEFLGSYEENFWGLQLAGICNWVREQSYGAEIAIFANKSTTAYGLQMAALCNYASELHGCQLGLINYAQECPWGFQIGLVNIIMDNKLKVLPLVNGFF